MFTLAAKTLTLMLFRVVQCTSRDLQLVRAVVDRGDDSTLYSLHFRASQKPTLFWRNGADLILPGGDDDIGFYFGGRDGNATLRTHGLDEVISVYLQVRSLYYDVHFQQQPGRSAKVEVNVPTSGITFSDPSNVTYSHGEAIITTLSVPKQRTNYRINGVHWQFVTVDDYDNPTGVVEYSDWTDGQSSYAPVREVTRLENETSVGARMQVATDRQDYEGILTVLVAVESTDDDSPVTSVDEGHVFFIRRDDHPFPFPPGFVGFISNSLTQGRVCQEGSPCNVPCLAVGVGLKSMKLYSEGIEGLEEVTATPYNINFRYMQFSEFRVPGPSQPGPAKYVCRAISDTTIADNVITVNFEEFSSSVTNVVYSSENLSNDGETSSRGSIIDATESDRCRVEPEVDAI